MATLETEGLSYFFEYKSG